MSLNTPLNHHLMGIQLARCPQPTLHYTNSPLCSHFKRCSVFLTLSKQRQGRLSYQTSAYCNPLSTGINISPWTTAKLIKIIKEPRPAARLAWRLFSGPVRERSHKSEALARQTKLTARARERRVSDRKWERERMKKSFKKIYGVEVLG